MSLNSRIYFHDHQSFERSGVQVSDRAHATAATSLHFAGTGPESQGLTYDSLQLYTVTQTVELVPSNGDNTSLDGSLVSPTAITFLPVNDSVRYPAPL